MKRFAKVILLSLTGVLLTSCGLFDKLSGKNDYSGYEEYFEKEKKYKKFTDMASFNKEIGETAYFWTTNSSSTYTAYYTGKSDLIMVYDTGNISVNFTDGKAVSIRLKDGVRSFKTDEVSLDEDGNVTYQYGGAEETLKMAKDNDGYLLVAYDKHMFYVTKDYKTVYVNEKNTNVFQGYEGTKTIASSDLLNNTLEALGAESRLQLPSPGENIEIWYGVEYYKDNPSNGGAYIANTHPAEYAKILEANGFTVIRSFEDEFYSFYGKDGGYWYCYDEKAEMEVYLSLEHYLYTTSLGKTFGPLLNTRVNIYRMKKGYNGERERNTQEDWKASDKEDMKEWYDGAFGDYTIPFIALSKHYSIPSKDIMSRAHTGILDGTFSSEQRCYLIFDDSNKYFLDGYDQVLEANGFHLFVPEHDLNNSKERSEFFNSDKAQFINCYLNEDKDMAVKYYFDVTFGNCIRVFKMSEMKSWKEDLK